MAAVLALLSTAAATTLVPWGLVGVLRDDGIYLLGARALRMGLGYIDLSLPSHPGVLRYPPGYSALLALATAGSHDLATELLRAQWVAPLSGLVTVLLAYRYFRRWGGLSGVLAIAATAWMAFQPMFVLISARVLADVPFAAYSLVVALVFEAAWVTASLPLAAWLGVGVLVGGAVMLRYAAVALVVACALVLALDRRWRPLVALLAGVALVVVPWLVYRSMIGGSDYVEAYTALAPHDLPGFIRAVGLVMAGLLASGLPGTVCGAQFPAVGPLAPTPGTFILGVAISAIVLLGAVAGFLRPTEGRSRFAEAYIFCTMAVGCVYALGFTWYADSFLMRAFLPILPFLVMAAIRGASTLFAPLGKRPRAVLVTLVVVMGLANNVLGSAAYIAGFKPKDAYTRNYVRLYDEVRRVTKPSDVLIAYEGHMVTLYTDRMCQTFPTFAAALGKDPRVAPPRLAIRYLVRTRPAYVVGTPDYGTLGGHDRTIALINGILAYAPGLLTQVYIGPGHNFALFKVDPKLLDRAAELLKEMDSGTHPPGK